MLQPHSFLWHYLWVGPHVLLAVLAFLTWRRGLYKLFPAFFVYLIFEAIQELTLYALDLLPSVSDDTYWRAYIAVLVIEILVKLAVIWELFSHLVTIRPSVARTGSQLIVCTGAALTVLAMLAAAHAPIANYALHSCANILEQSFYLIEAGLLLFVFILAAYWHLVWDRRFFGIALGLSVSACVGLSISAINANGIFFAKRYLLDFLNMGAYHGCVLLWFYYLLSAAWPVPSANAPGTETINKRANGPDPRRVLAGMAPL
jgi:hypothetical protein